MLTLILTTVAVVALVGAAIDMVIRRQHGDKARYWTTGRS